MSKSTTVNENGFTVYTLHPLLMVDVKVYYNQLEWVYTLQFTPFADGRCQSLVQSTRMGLHFTLYTLC